MKLASIGLLALANADPEGSIRLNANDPGQEKFRNSKYGRLEMVSGGRWGTICESGFDRKAAEVACRSLGFRSAGWVSNYFKISKGNIGNLMIETGRKIHYSDFVCNGEESGLMECKYNGAEELPCMCTEEHDVVMQCKGKCPINPETEQPDCTLPDKPKMKPKHICEGIPADCMRQFENNIENTCNGCRQWLEACEAHPSISHFVYPNGRAPPTTVLITTTLPETTTTTTTTSTTTTTVAETTTVDPASMSGSKTGDDSEDGDSSSNDGANCRMLEGGGQICDEVEEEDEFPSDGAEENDDEDLGAKPNGIVAAINSENPFDSEEAIKEAAENNEWSKVEINNILNPHEPIADDNPIKTEASPDVLDEAEEFPRDEYDTTYMNTNEEFDRDSQSDDPEIDEGNLSSEEAVELVEEEIREEEAEEIEDEFESEDRKSPMPTSEPKPVHVPTSPSQPEKKHLPANTQKPIVQNHGEVSDARKADGAQNDDEPEVSIASMGNIKIPAWVWILVAIISVIVILCLVLAITRCVRNGSGRVLYNEPGPKGPKV
ncbi:Oidioi.mRNA.OKI2018_I69.PAR.g11676.t2.cds [Oikopleura dioica]|uniref:Oidioi.mRNA.OKI2018_I69.PAR.g11676.t2.cds n=1 Tax=Oikopleura dioica TaxID=34765 RepID=A0ABN7S2J9_OIKDI|nr:Oidioi.mRNA.OKI2018_I69.PAR.g11676.t2.cds [Oikopleura dioica]